MTTASPTPRVVVIGGGITGLTAAYRLRRLAQTVGATAGRAAALSTESR